MSKTSVIEVIKSIWLSFKFNFFTQLSAPNKSHNYMDKFPTGIQIFPLGVELGTPGSITLFKFDRKISFDYYTH